MSAWEGGKGSKRRKEDKKKIDANWDANKKIFTRTYRKTIKRF